MNEYGDHGMGYLMLGLIRNASHSALTCDLEPVAVKGFRLARLPIVMCLAEMQS